MKIFTLSTVRTCLLFLSGSFFTICHAQTNQGLVMDGQSAHVDIGVLAPAGNFSNGLTLECWARFNSFNNWTRLFDLGNGEATDNILFANESYNNNLRFEVYDEGYSQGISGTPIDLYRWYHFAVTLDAGWARMYIDGMEVASGPVQMPRNVDRYTNYIGRSNWSFDDYMDGLVDEIRIWDVARTQSEIRQYMFSPVVANAPGLVAYFRCNDAPGSFLANTASGGSPDASFYGDRVPTPGLFSANALNFDGVDDYVHISSPLSAGSSYTKEAWVYITKSRAVPNNIISSANSPFWIDGNRLRAGNSGPSATVTDVTNFPSNTWVHVAVTYNHITGAITLFRNGVPVAGGTTGQPYQAADNYIGAWYNDENLTTESYWGGNIDEVRIWNVARTPAEILSNMNRELNPSEHGTLVSYYTFNLGTPAGNNHGFQTLYDQMFNLHGTLNNFDLTGGMSTNWVQQAGLFSTLPVHMSSFITQKQGNHVFIQWTTAQEQNSADFLVEHSNDGSNWNALVTVAAAGNSHTTRVYDHTHTSPARGKNYYRIKQRDLDGTFTVSKVNMVAIEDGQALFSLQSNVTENGTLQAELKKPVLMSLHTNDGKLIWRKKFAEGRQFLQLGSTTKGIYLLSAEGTTVKILVK